VEGLAFGSQKTETEINEQRERVVALKQKLLATISPMRATCRPSRMPGAQERLGPGRDGWAYDIGYGGLDHVLLPARM